MEHPVFVLASFTKENPLLCCVGLFILNILSLLYLRFLSLCSVFVFLCTKSLKKLLLIRKLAPFLSYCSDTIGIVVRVRFLFKVSVKCLSCFFVEYSFLTLPIRLTIDRSSLCTLTMRFSKKFSTLSFFLPFLVMKAN